MKTQLICLATLCIVLAAGVSTGRAIGGMKQPNYSLVPEADLRAVAREIEEQVAAGNREAELNDHGEIVVNTEALRHAVRTRAARYAILSELLDSGHAWERRNGRVWIVRSNAYKTFGTKNDRNRHALIVNSENRDRWLLYESIIKDNNLPQKALATVQSIFSEERFELLKPGQKYETPSGEVAVR